MLPLVVLPEAATAANQTFLVVNCPHEAEVRIDDFLTKSTGPSRLFRLSCDQSNLPRRVQIAFTTYATKYRTEYEYTEVAHCQPGKTTTISMSSGLLRPCRDARGRDVAIINELGDRRRAD